MEREKRASNHVALVEVINGLRRLELPIDDHPSPLNRLHSDPQRLHGKPALIPCCAPRFTNGHWLVHHFENADRDGVPLILGPRGALN
jgi:hypothetical protein